MTVIATDGLSMSGDGQTSCGWMITDLDTVKVQRLPDGRIFGLSGNASDKVAFRKFLTDGVPATKMHENFAALVLNPGGLVEWYDESLTPLACSAPQAIGCGKEFALAAMDAGLDAEGAVKIACKRSTHCGGTVTTLRREGVE